MYTDTLIQLGLAQNEARIYETLLREGESSVGDIATKSGVHRRNVYDSLNRLLEKGLVFEILERRENRYQAVDPGKLSEMLQEKQRALAGIMPSLESLYSGTPHRNDVFIYKGVEGWKNYIRDILRLGQDLYVIGARGAWRGPKLKSFTEQFEKEARAKGIQFYQLFDHTLRDNQDILTHWGPEYRILPEKYSTHIAADIYGDRVVLLSGLDNLVFDEDASLTVIVNQQIADGFRTWFQLMWDACPPNQES